MSNASAQLKTFTNKIKKGLLKTISAREMQAIAEFCIAQIKERSRRGFGLKSERSGGSESRFPALAKTYIEQRKRTKLSPFTSAGKSNITRSGRMLASLRYKTREGAARIEPTGKSREGIPNQDVAGFLADQGRYFMGLTDKQIKALLKFVDSNIKKIK
jgi:hypothetical protein